MGRKSDENYVKEIEEYVAERNKALENLDVSEFIRFLVKHKNVIGATTVNRFLKSDEIVQKATMCKMVVNIISFKGTETWSKAIEWLTEHKMSGEIQWQ